MLHLSAWEQDDSHWTVMPLTAGRVAPQGKEGEAAWAGVAFCLIEVIEAAEDLAESTSETRD